MGLAKGQTEDEFAVTTHRILQLSTIDAARALGIADVTGSLTPGKRADLIMVRGDDLNIAPFTDAANMIALAAQPSNVDIVISDGRILKYDGHLTTLDPHRIVRDAAASLAAVLARAG
jgi:imidazolonepropionase-like amidohydrolase